MLQEYFLYSSGQDLISFSSFSTQVPAGCCNKPQMKYNNVLKTNSTDLVCCNTPCTDMKEKDGCQLPDRCSSGPEGRSLFGGGGGGRGGSYGHGGPIFNKHLVRRFILAKTEFFRPFPFLTEGESS